MYLKIQDGGLFQDNTDWSEFVDIPRVPITDIRCPAIGLRHSITNIRKPIIGLRCPIKKQEKKQPRKINFNAKKYQGLSESELRQLESLAKFGQKYIDNKLKQMRKSSKSVVTEQEKDCIDNFVPYYENLICKLTGEISHELLPTKKKKLSRNWTSVFKCYKMCIEKEYDYRVYLDAQFESYKSWEHKDKIRYPLPNMLCTERAIKAYENYVYHNETAYKNEGWEKKLVSNDVGNYLEEVKKQLEKDLKTIETQVKYYRGKYSRDFKNVDRSRKDIENLYYSKAVQQCIENLSIESWVIIPQVDMYTDRMYGNFSSMDSKIDDFDELMENNRKVEVIREAWRKLNVPKLYGLYDVDRLMKNDK